MSQVFLPQSPNEQEKFSYILKRPWVLKLLYIVSILSWLITLLGYYSFLSKSVYYWFIFAPFILFVTIFHFLSLGINFFYKKFDIPKHGLFVQNYWNSLITPITIDVYLPICGEDIEILENTWKGVAEIANSENCKNGKYIINPLVLDDKGDTKVQLLAKQFGFRYLSRPDRGVMKKAGNLKYGFEHTDGDFAVILDADFRPRSDFVDDLLPYMSLNNIGIVQSPQFFDYDHRMHKRSVVEFGAGSIQEYFYKVIQPSRDRFGGAICVGSCAIYRREALLSIGGTVQIEHSEDMYTGFKLLTKGWKVKYIPLALSKGVCPDDLNSFFKQQTRWCNGNMIMMVDREFWTTKLPIMTKLCYISGFMGYIFYQVSLFLMLQTLILLAFYNESVGILNLLLFVPNLVNAVVIQYFYVYPRSKIGTIVGHAAATWFYNFTIIALLFGHEEGWNPTGLKPKISRGFVISLIAPGVYVCFITMVLILAILSGRVNLYNGFLYPILFWIFASVFYHLLFWLYGINYLSKSDPSTLPWIVRYQKFIFPTLVFICVLSLIYIPKYFTTSLENILVITSSKSSSSLVASVEVVEKVSQDSIPSVEPSTQVTQDKYVVKVISGDNLATLVEKISDLYNIDIKLSPQNKFDLEKGLYKYYLKTYTIVYVGDDFIVPVEVINRILETISIKPN